MFKKKKKFKVVGVYIHINRTNGKNEITKLRGKEGIVLNETKDRILGEIDGKEYSLPKDIIEIKEYD